MLSHTTSIEERRRGKTAKISESRKKLQSEEEKLATLKKEEEQKLKRFTNSWKKLKPDYVNQI